MKFQIHRGTNISHWLSQSQERGQKRRERLTQDDVKRLADLGVDHLRLPVDEEQLWNEEGKQEQEAWELLNAGLDWCRESELRAIVDLHIIRSHHFNAGPEGKTLFTDSVAAQRFAQLWIEFSKALRSRSNEWVAYELLNEAVADNPNDWNRVLQVPYNAIRESEPERVIAIGSNRWCQAATFRDLDVPSGDPNIILVFHYYTPMLITHYRASWVPSTCDYDGPLNYPGKPIPEEALVGLEPNLQKRLKEANKPFDITVIEKDIAPALELSKKMNLPLWCNEFGVIAGAPDDIRRKWYSDFVSVLESHSIVWTNWDFRGGFGLFDRQNNPTVVAETLFG